MRPFGLSSVNQVGGCPRLGGATSSHITVRTVRYTAVSRQRTTRGVGVAVFGSPFVDKRSDPPLAFRATRGSAATVKKVLCAFPNARLTTTSSC